MRRPRLVYAVTHPVTADSFLRGQLAFMRERGFDVTVLASPGPELERVAAREGVRTVAVPIERAISPERDAVSLARLTAALQRAKPDIVNASTPKAGLLGMIAARAIRVPVRIYLLRGLRLETATGTLRRILGRTEQLASACAHEVVCNSPSLMRAAIEGGWVPAHKARVIGDGSSNGVDPDRWVRTEARIEAGTRRLREAGIAEGDEIIGFVGRFDRDKGIVDLVDAFERVRDRRPRARLVLVGAGFAGDEDPEIAARVRRASGVVTLGKTDDLAPLLACMDVLAFPSLREGFPNVPLEAGCAELPVVGYRSTGVVDAVDDGVTGALVAQRDVPALAAALLRYLDDPAMRGAHGRAGRARAVSRFSHRVVWTRWEEHYRKKLEAAGL